MKNKYFLEGFLTEHDSENKKFKIIYNGNNMTEKIIKSFCKQELYNPVFPNGCWIKYDRNTKFFNKSKECILYDIIDNHVSLEVYKVNYSYPDRTGWILKACLIKI